MGGIVAGIARKLGTALEVLMGLFLDPLSFLPVRTKQAPDLVRPITAPPGPLQEVAGDPPRPEAAKRRFGAP